MKKKLLILILLFFVSTTVNAQVGGGKIAIENLSTLEADSEVVILFDAVIARNAVGRTQTYTFIPVLTDGTYYVSLPAIVIEGRKNKATRRRYAWAGGETAGRFAVTYAKNGEIVRYIATVQAQEWMQGSQLGIEGVMAGCCTVTVDPMVVIAESLHLYDEPQPVEVVKEVKVFKPRTVADSLSMIFPFVVPESMFDAEDPFRIYDEERESSMIVYFHQSRHDIDPDYRDNRQTLTNLTAAIEMILRETDNRIERVVVAGFASPEGRYAFNDRLAFDRAVAVKHHLLQTTPLKDEQVWLHNGSVDWQGLRLLVSGSSMPEKHRVLDIINHTPLGDSGRQTGRLGELMRLDDGVPYRYMLREFFPLLRNGAFIKVYYSNR